MKEASATRSRLAAMSERYPAQLTSTSIASADEASGVLLPRASGDLPTRHGHLDGPRPSPENGRSASDNHGQPWASSAQLSIPFWPSTAGRHHHPALPDTEEAMRLDFEV